MASEETLTASSAEFVLRAGPADDDAVVRARHLGTVERFAAAPELCLLRLGAAKASPKSAWQATTRALGAGIALFPVLHDAGGAAHYPTGEITVRFDSAPSDDELARFCAAQRLRALRRNAFVAQQVVCEALAAAEEFLPEIVARLAAEPGVRRAWANTLSHYRRAET